MQPTRAEISSGACASAPQRQIGVGSCRISDRAKSLVMEVLESNRLSAGPMTRQFESEVARLHDCRFGVMSNSGTSALQVALAALKEKDGWRDGDEVLVPATTFIATSNAVIYNQLTPVFVDVEPEYFDIDPGRIEDRISPRTRAIMPVHVGGLPCDMDPILEIARRRNLRVVEDSAECMFVRYGERPVGSFGDIACFSTYAAHIVSTGVGGVSITNDGDLHILMRSLINHGRDSIYIRIDDDEGLDGERLHEVASRRFSFVRFGHSFRATEMEAALGVAQLEERHDNESRRAEVARRYSLSWADLSPWLQLPAIRAATGHAFMFYPLVVRGGTSRDLLIAFLEDRGIETRPLLPLINQPIYRQLFGDLDDRYPIAAALNRDAFYVGCHPDLTDDEVDYVIATMREFFRREKA